MKPALFSETLEHGSVQCLLCPHACLLEMGRVGLCGVRKNEGGILRSLNYGKISAIHLDPVEKKPLYHFFPGSMVLSVGSVGCNMQCSFCQNCEISQWQGKDFTGLRDLNPKGLVEMALLEEKNIGLAYTYNEPLVFIEFLLDSARLAREHELLNIMITNGFISLPALRELVKVIDAFNVDLKAFNEGFYRKITKSALAPVLHTLERVREAGKHLEITYLVVPEQNDNEREFSSMIQWIQDSLGAETILHLSRYFPHYKSVLPPTSPATLLRLHAIAKEKLKYVYIGNMESPQAQNTYCPVCAALLVKRQGYRVQISGLTGDGSCLNCGKAVVRMQRCL